MSRPVFVPKSKRRPKKPYFHGAFTGGFSAGYFNTVGSKEGWTPRDNQDDVEQQHDDEVLSQKSKRPQQRMEDYMDEQDHNEWGGPTAVKKEYDQSSTQRQASLSVLERVVAEPPPNVGRRLLRVLGWRDGSTAYVPLYQHDDAGPSCEASTDEQTLLTAKKLRRIRLQQSRVKIPVPKLDLCGLGFSPHRNAPEFQRHLEKRKRLARKRARAATGSGGGRNVYRTSHLLDDENDDGIETHGEENDHDDHNVSYETVQDFVGSKTVGGFALREDDDDVYDDNPVANKSGELLKVDDNEYDTVVYEHDSDEEGGDSRQSSGQDFGGVLSSWAALQGTAPATAASSNRGVTSDGRPPLAGFVLGTSDAVKISGGEGGEKAVRYAGPDVPINYTLKRHDFGQEEHPEMLAEKSRSIQRQMVMERKHTVAVQSLVTSQPKGEKTKPHQPMAGATFAGLGAAMKSRFTSGDTSASRKESTAVHPFGLHIPQSSTHLESVTEKEVSPVDKSVSPQKEDAISITRSVFTFVPESLLCKRFHVHVPKSSASSTVTKEKHGGAEGSETFYFHNEILQPAAAERAKKGSQGAESNPDSEHKPIDNVDVAPLPNPVDRPSMKVFKSIFEPESASSESEDDSKDEESQTGLSQAQFEDNGTSSSKVNEGVGVALGATHSASSNVRTETTDAALTSHPLKAENKTKTAESNRTKGQCREESSVHSEVETGTERRRRRRRSHQSTSVGSSSADDSLDSRRRRKKKKERRKRDEKKKRRKRHKSSRRS